MTTPKGILIRDHAGLDYSGFGQGKTREQIAATCETIKTIHARLLREHRHRARRRP